MVRYLSFYPHNVSFTPPLLSGAAPVSAGVIAGAVVTVVAIVLIILIVLLIVSFLKYHNKGTRTMCVVRVVLADTGS